MKTLIPPKEESCHVIRDHFLLRVDYLITSNVFRMLFDLTIALVVVAIPLPVLADNTSDVATTYINQELKLQSPYICNSLVLHVESKSIEDIQNVCSAALAVASFYRDMGLSKIPTMHVTIVDNIPPEAGPDALGCFAPESGGIHILSYSAASKCGSLFGRHMDRALYRSLAAHEIAHAFASCNASVEKLSLRAGEYVAYVTMFATMDHNHRQAILEDNPGIGFENEKEISDTYYYLSPCQFGINAYRHFIRPENGNRFFQSVIRGQVLLKLKN